MTRHLLSAMALGMFVAAVQADDYKPADAAAMQDASKTLLADLKATPGCLGVETAKTDSGKQVVFAFFENKKAVLAWYNSPTHQKLVGLLNPNRSKKYVPL